MSQTQIKKQSLSGRINDSDNKKIGNIHMVKFNSNNPKAPLYRGSFRLNGLYETFYFSLWEDK